jgi:hypothetical protein
MPSRSTPITSAVRATISQKPCKRAVAAALQVMRIERKAQHAARFGQRAQDRVGLVAPRRVPEGGVGMGDRDGPRADLDRLQRGAFGGMAHVDDKAHAVHLGDDLAAHAGEARILRLVAARRQQRLVVVAQLHEAQAERVQDLHQADIVLDGRGRLGAEDDGGAPLVLRAADVVAGLGVADQVGKRSNRRFQASILATVSRNIS